MNEETEHDLELRRRLQAADPAHRNPATDSWIPDLVEATMNTPTTNTPDESAPRTRTWLPLVAAAALVAAITGGYLALGGGSDDKDKVAAEPTSIALALPGSDAMNMCMRFEVAMLEQAPVAFSGTVASVTDGKVTLDVDHWYKGGDADQVVLENEGAAAQVALDGVDFQAGKRYLVSASDGVVSTCGYSGPWSEEYAAQFDQAFGS